MGRRYFKDYAAFVDRFVAGSGRSALDHFDAHALRALQGQERAEAIEVLQEHLDSGANDPRAVAALVALRPKGLVEELRRLMEISLDETGVAAARALWRLKRDPAAVQTLVEIMQSSYDESAQRAAAAALGKLPPSR